LGLDLGVPECLLDFQLLLVEVDVLPLERQQLTESGAGKHCGLEQDAILHRAASMIILNSARGPNRFLSDRYQRLVTLWKR